MNSFFDRAKRFKKKASGVYNSQRSSLKFFVRNNLTKEFLKNLSKGRVIISKEVIEDQLSRALENDEQVDLQFVSCSKNGVYLSLLINRGKAKARVNFTLYVELFKLSTNKQQIIIKISEEKIKGLNLKGKIIATFTQTIISSLISKSIFPKNIPNTIKYQDDYTTAVVHLEDFDFIKKLRQPLLGTSLCILDFISIIGAEHTPQGINIKVKHTFSQYSDQ